MNKTIIFLDEFHRLASILPGLAGDIFVTVENDLRWEGRMATYANRDVSPSPRPRYKDSNDSQTATVPSAGYFRSCLPCSSAPPRPAPDTPIPLACAQPRNRRLKRPAMRYFVS